MIFKPELISPAGNLEKLNFVFRYGADGAYLGGKIFNLRDRAENFSFSDLIKAKKLADEFNKKIYFTLNIYFRNNDFNKLGHYCEKLLNTGITNIIVSDLGVLYFINKNFKNCFNLCASTQANITNFYAIDLLKEFNIKRVIPARELSLKEIKEIKKNTKIELETFIHGAMCVAYSGRCLLSEYMAGRNANRGDCTQSCRWDYYLIEKTRPQELFPIYENQKATAILSSKDLCTLFIFNKLMKLKIDAFKIEGRMKSLYYAANVTRVYRQIIDNILKNEKSDNNFLFQELNAVSHRPYFTGFLIPNKGSLIHDDIYIRKYKFIGFLKRKIKDNLYILNLKDKIEIGDKIEIILPNMINLKIIKFKLYDKAFKKVERGIINNNYYIEIEDNTAEWGIIRKQMK